MDSLSVRGHPQERNKNKGSRGRSKSKGRSKSPGKGIRKCWKCGKVGNYKKDYISKNFEKAKGSEDTTSTVEKTSSKEGGDVYLASTDNHSEREIWLIDSSASCHMTPHRESFCEYEKYNGGDVFLGDNSTITTIGFRRVKLHLNDGMIITLI